MKIKRLKTVRINCAEFSVKWNKDYGGGRFDYGESSLEIGTASGDNNVIFMILCHEIMEICAEEMSVRFRRTDVNSDYIFVYDHRQHDTMINMFSGLISQFIN